MGRPHPQSGFTLFEALITVALVAVLCTLGFMSLGRTQQTTATLEGITEALVADLRSQQQAAMSGSGSQSTAQSHGIFIAANQYSLFADTYNSENNNYTVSPGQGISFTTTLPNTQIAFTKASGDPIDFATNSHTITVHTGSRSKTITINHLGAVRVE